MGGVEHSTLHHLYARFIWKALFDLGQLPPEVGEEPFRQLRLHGWTCVTGAKMSKSRGNVVNPDEYVRQYGADVMRAHMLFIGTYAEGGDFLLGYHRHCPLLQARVGMGHTAARDQVVPRDEKIRRGGRSTKRSRKWAKICPRSVSTRLSPR